MSYEDLLKNTIFPELELGRPNWDKPHTEVVVEYVKNIISNSTSLSVDRDVLIIAAYAHDWGYSGLYKSGEPLKLSDVTNAKEAHMEIGAQKIAKLLNNNIFDFLSENQKQRVVHLVQYHDMLSALKDNDELILMEADTLGGLDVTKVKPSFDKESNEKYMIGVKTKRYPRFITEYGKRQFEKLYKLRENYYKS